ncbi:MAG: prenyltransferase/squalene oxidase repeat-containing protein [Planctomycetota bacterium]|jgi:hypothetical protein
MRVLQAGLLVAVLGGMLGGSAGAEDQGPPAAPAQLVTLEERDGAISRGIGYLQRTVFQLPDATGTPRKQFTVAVTGLVDLLAGDGRTSTTRRRSTLAEKARRFLEAYVTEVRERTVDPAQLAETSDATSSAHAMQYTWPIAMAGIFFGEMHARGLNEAEAARTLRTIVAILEAAQAPNGGWGHAQFRGRGKPRGPSEMDGFGAYPDTLLASSNLVATSLVLVRPVAPPEKDDVFDRALTYFEYAELANGSFPYDPSQRAAHIDMTGVSRSAGAVLAMRLMGIEEDDIGVSRALELVDEHFEYLSEGHGSSTLNLLLAAFLQRLRGTQAWSRFKETFFRRILDDQAADGSFTCICQNKAFGSTNDSRPAGGGAGGPAAAFFANHSATYVSAIHTLILLLDRTWPRLVPEAPSGPHPGGPTTPR